MKKVLCLSTLQYYGEEKIAALSLNDRLGNIRERHKGFDHELSHDIDGDLIGFLQKAASASDNFPKI